MSMMQLPSDQLAAIRLDDVRLYFTSHGWKKDSKSSNDKRTVYRYSNLPEAEAILPGYRDLADYVDRMADAAQVLAAVEQRNVWQVLADLSSPSADVLRLQVSAPDMTLGMLPLTDGINLINGGKALLLAASCSVHSPQAHHPRQAYKESVEFLDTCQLGQTERGSFIAKIVAPVPPQINKQAELFDKDMEDEEALFAAEPFSRQSTVRLMTALNHIYDSIDSGNFERIFDGIKMGVSANLCEAVASMRPKGDQSNLRITMNWSSNRPRLPVAVKSAIGFSQTAFDIVRESGRKLRETVPPTTQLIKGLVINLRADPSLLDEFVGKVVLKAKVDSSTARVQLSLNSEDYKKACDAHRDNQLVTVKGLLKREAKGYCLTDPQDFSLARPT